MNKNSIEFRELDVEQLQQKIIMLQQELFSLKFSSSTTHVKNYAQFSLLRKNIARGLTYLNQKTKTS